MNIDGVHRIKNDDGVYLIGSDRSIPEKTLANKVVTQSS